MALTLTRLIRKKSGSRGRPRPGDEMDLMQHLDELRARLIRCAVYATVAGVVAWYWVYEWMFTALTAPLLKVMQAHGIKGGLIWPNLLEPFLLKMKVCAILAVLITSPLLLWEVWGFISPGLHAHERKPFKFVFPLAVTLFVLGASLSFAILPAAIAWFLSYSQPNVQLMQHVSDYILFVVKMCAAFGLGFELPVVLMFAGKIGLIRDTTMRLYWRQAVVVVMIVAAVITPSNDPLSMMMMATPMAFLYLGSISLVKWVQPKVTTRPYGDEDEEDDDNSAASRIPIDPEEED